MEQIKNKIYYLPHAFIYYFYKWFFYKKNLLNQKKRSLIVDKDQNSLKGFDEHKCIFIHIPKAAGVSLSNILFGNLGGGHRPIYSYYTVFPPKEFNKYFKFTIVRNPWDRLVSAYYFLKEGGHNNIDKQWFEDNLAKYESFESFVCDWLNEKNIYSFTHFIPQNGYLYFNGRVLVDKIYKFEVMDQAIIDINIRLNLNGTMVVLNRTKNRKIDYRNHFNNETRQIVEKVYADDIKLLKYTF